MWDGAFWIIIMYYVSSYIYRSLESLFSVVTWIQAQRTCFRVAIDFIMITILYVLLLLGCLQPVCMPLDTSMHTILIYTRQTHVGEVLVALQFPGTEFSMDRELLWILGWDCEVGGSWSHKFPALVSFLKKKSLVYSAKARQHAHRSGACLSPKLKLGSMLIGQEYASAPS